MSLLSMLFGKKDNSALTNLIKEGAFLVDVRSPAEFASGHVDGSVNIPVDSIKSQLHLFKNKQQIIVYCASGMRSSAAKALLSSNGFTNVTNGGNWRAIQDIVTAR